MRLVIQRVNHASVKVDGANVGAIDKGLLLLLGVGPDDDDEDISYLTNKVLNMRLFPDDHGKMSLSVKDINGGILVISQFTLFASTKKGNRPSFSKAASPEMAKQLYDEFVEKLWHEGNIPIQTGQFAADMKVSLENDGPVTITMDSKERV